MSTFKIRHFIHQLQALLPEVRPWEHRRWRWANSKWTTHGATHGSHQTAMVRRAGDCSGRLSSWFTWMGMHKLLFLLVFFIFRLIYLNECEQIAACARARSITRLESLRSHCLTGIIIQCDGLYFILTPITRYVALLPTSV